jgi:NAD(P)H dehydrogenase (quinone)
MRVLVLSAHPVETSFNAALHHAVVARLADAGHTVDDCDLYAEGFDPRLTREERLAYHDVPTNQASVATHVERLLAAEGLVLVYPVWNFGFPAILKGYFDRVFLPGVAFDLTDGTVRPALKNITRLGAVTTYGATRLRAFLAGDPPSRLVKRVLRATMQFPPVTYLAHYDMNRSTDASRQAFLGRVEQAMLRF